MPRAQRQDRRTQSFFEHRAAVWHRNYMPNGEMVGRVSRFVDALAGLRTEHGCLLDFGSGTGEIACALAAHGWKVIGCDTSPAMIEMARSAKGGSSVEWTVLEANGFLPFPEAKFDVVIASSVFEYLADPLPVLNELTRVLIPGGSLFATVPDTRHPYRKVEETRRRILRIVPLRLFLQLTPWRHVVNYLHLSVNRYSVEEWCALLEAAKLHPKTAPSLEETLVLLEARKER